ncbi:MAG TPA: GIY-YIG nuclease family protein [Chitinivibrionales bacterium]|jgi:hypothetical protein|nr:GIY-YIG nuclease family protein [Chitinivibrionales bacterium]
MSSRKDLIRSYKQRVAPMGVFRVTNTANGKILIGSSKSLDTKFNSILFQLKIGRFPNPALQADFETCGETNFSYEVIDTLEPKDDPLYKYEDDLRTLEELWLDKLKPYDEKGYNTEKQRK